MFRPLQTATTAILLATCTLAPPTPVSAEDAAAKSKAPAEIPAEVRAEIEAAIREKLPDDVAALVDVDGDGRISDEEARRAAAEFQKRANGGRAAKGRKAILEALDRDRDGKIAPLEARAGVARERMMNDATGKVVAKIFDDLDADSSETIDVWEFKLIIKKLGPLGQLAESELGDFFNRMDANRDGRITMVEAQMTAQFFAKVAEARKAQAEAADQKLWDMSEQTLKGLDRNKDGRVSPREARRNKPLAAVFAAIDADRDEVLTTAEIYDYAKKVRKLQKALGK